MASTVTGSVAETIAPYRLASRNVRGALMRHPATQLNRVCWCVLVRICVYWVCFVIYYL